MFYEIIKDVIGRGGYNLTSVLSRIDMLWAEGELTNEQRNELTNLARNKADASAEVDLFSMIVSLDKRVKKLEDELSETSDTAPPEEYDPYRVYYAGDSITFKNETYDCIAPDGKPCSWSPDGYPPYWKKREGTN